MRVTIVVVLLLWSLFPLNAAADVGDKLRAIPADTPLEVRLKSKEQVRGLRGDVSSENLIVKVSANGASQDRVIALADVKSVKLLKTKHTGRNIGIGVAIGLSAAAAILGYMVTHITI